MEESRSVRNCLVTGTKVPDVAKVGERLTGTSNAAFDPGWHVIPVFTIGRRAVPLVRELSLSPRVHLPGARAAPLRRFPPGGRRAACGICGIPLGPLALPGGRLTVSRGASLILGACRFAAAAPKLYARAEARNLWVAQGQPAGSASTKRRMPHLLRRES